MAAAKQRCCAVFWLRKRLTAAWCVFEPGLKIGYVEQGFQNIGTGSLWQFMLRSCPEIVTMREELAALEARSAQLEPGAELDGVLEEYARVTKRYEHVDGYNL